MLMLELAPDCGIPSHSLLSQKQIILSRGRVKTFFSHCGMKDCHIVLRGPAAEYVELSKEKYVKRKAEN